MWSLYCNDCLNHARPHICSAFPTCQAWGKLINTHSGSFSCLIVLTRTSVIILSDMVEEDILLFFLNGEILRFPLLRIVLGSQVSMAHTFNPSTEEAETDRQRSVSLHSETLSQINKQQTNKCIVLGSGKMV